jgi:hypothetical protein
MRRLPWLLSLLLLTVLPASSAAAGGLPATDRAAGPDGVVGPGGAFRFGALSTGDGTAVTKTSVRGGRVKRATVLQGRWGVPVVAEDGTSGGISADGSTLVLRRFPSTYPPRRTTFVVLGTGRLAIRATIDLKGQWGFDALSPDASTLYLIQTTNVKANRYAVRAYDMRAGRLLPDPVVDPTEPDEPMRGFPVTRTTGPGARWVYTLYVGGEHPFIHALDTVRRTSLCLDLPHRVTQRLWQARLAIRGSKVHVVRRGKVIASASRRPQEASAGGGPPWVVAALVLSGLAAAAGVRRLTASRA